MCSCNVPAEGFIANHHIGKLQISSMVSPRLAARYAKSLIDFAQEKGQLEAVFKDIKYLEAVIKQSRDFVNLLRSPVIKADKKQTIIDTVTRNKVTELTAAFTRLLVIKGRENALPEIVNAFIDQYNKLKGIHQVKLTTAVPLSEELKNEITKKMIVEAGLGKIELQTKVDEDLIGGFVLEFNNNKVDASIVRDLLDVKKQFMNNEYILKIR